MQLRIATLVLMLAQSTPGFRFQPVTIAAGEPVAYARTTLGGGTSGTGDRITNMTTAVAGSLLVAFVTVRGNTNNTPTMSDDHADGLGTWTFIGVQSFNSAEARSSVFVRDALLGSTDTAFVVTAATGSNSSGGIAILEFTGMQRVGAAAVRSYGGQSSQATGTTPAPALNQAALTGNMTIASANGLGTAATPNADWTERADGLADTPNAHVEVATRDSGFTGTTITFGDVYTGAYSSHALELDGSAP